MISTPHFTSTKIFFPSGMVAKTSLMIGIRVPSNFSFFHEPTSRVFSCFNVDLATIPDGKKIFVEVKCGVEIIPPLVKEIKESKLDAEQVILICFKAEVVKSFKEILPYHKAFWLSGFKKDKKGAWNPSIESVLATIKSCTADGLDSQHSIPNEFSKAVLDAGYEWHAWTINDVPTAKRLAKRGIYSITTDRPKLIASGLGK